MLFSFRPRLKIFSNISSSQSHQINAKGRKVRPESVFFGNPCGDASEHDFDPNSYLTLGRTCLVEGAGGRGGGGGGDEG